MSLAKVYLSRIHFSHHKLGVRLFQPAARTANLSFQERVKKKHAGVGKAGVGKFEGSCISDHYEAGTRHGVESQKESVGRKKKSVHGCWGR